MNEKWKGDKSRRRVPRTDSMSVLKVRDHSRPTVTLPPFYLPFSFLLRYNYLHFTTGKYKFVPIMLLIYLRDRCTYTDHLEPELRVYLGLIDGLVWLNILKEDKTDLWRTNWHCNIYKLRRQNPFEFWNRVWVTVGYWVWLS